MGMGWELRIRKKKVGTKSSEFIATGRNRKNTAQYSRINVYKNYEKAP